MQMRAQAVPEVLLLLLALSGLVLSYPTTYPVGGGPLRFIEQGGPTPGSVHSEYMNLLIPQLPRKVPAIETFVAGLVCAPSASPVHLSKSCYPSRGDVLQTRTRCMR
jgi:hypothetical protein